MQRVNGFLTSDGKFFFFDKKYEAEQHQTSLDFQQWCRHNICIGGEWTSEMISRAILENFKVTRK